MRGRAGNVAGSGSPDCLLRTHVGDSAQHDTRFGRHRLRLIHSRSRLQCGQFLANLIDPSDVGMIQRGDGTGFPSEAPPELRLRKLDCDHAVETGVAGFPHLAHAAHPRRAEQLTGSNDYRPGVRPRATFTSSILINCASSFQSVSECLRTGFPALPIPSKSTRDSQRPSRSQRYDPRPLDIPCRLLPRNP